MELHERIESGRNGNRASGARSSGADLQKRITSRRGKAETETRPIDPFAEIKTSMHLAIIGELGPQLYNTGADPILLRERVVESIEKRLSKEAGISHDDRLRLAGEIEADILGYGPIETLLGDESVSEVMINGPYDIWLERDGLLSRTSLAFNDESHLRRIINKMVAQVGRRIDESSPMVDARLPDGSRVNAVVPPLSLSGPIVTVRKFQHRRFFLDDLIASGTLSRQAADFLHRCVKAQLNILISGGTGTGKTTLLNALSESISGDERIVTIEDAAELRLRQDHVLRLESRPKNIEGEGEITIRDLVRNALRMRPDRIIVGEVRGAEALDMLQAMNTGHDGSLSTIHCNSPRDALMRIETMVMMAGFDLPVRAIRQQVASALDLIVHLERMDDGSRRVTSITEVQRMEGEIISLQDLFAFRPHGKSLELLPTGLRPSEDKFRKHGVELPGTLFDARTRPETARR